MRVQSIYEVSTNMQQYPDTMRNAGYTAAGKSASQISFEECLRAQYQKDRPTAMRRKKEGRVYDAPRGHYSMRGASIRSDLMLKVSAY